MNQNLLVLLLKKLVLLPYQEVRLELNMNFSKKIIDIVMEKYNSKILVICPINTIETSPSEADLPNVGVFAKIKSKIELPNGNYRITLAGLNRVIVKQYRNFLEDKNILECTVKRLYIDTTNEREELAISRTLKSVVDRYMNQNPAASNSVCNSISNIEDLDMLTDIITNYMPFDLDKKVFYMNEFDYVHRANQLIKDINVELEILDIETKIDDEIHDSIEKEQRDFILKQKINKLNEELGINADKQTEIDLFKEKVSQLDISDKTREKLLDEVRKYSYTSETNPDSSVIRNYLDTIIHLPWNKYSKDEKDLKKIKKVLDKSHFGLNETKMRVLEFIAVKKNSGSINAPIICLVGPPGTGKTTLGISISQALNREFYKVSVGGLNDATELIGHKRTYLGSSPGKIMQGIKKCGTANPVILIDEVDKMVQDYKGDPSAVLLEILDSTQNNTFIDNYIEEPFDLSKVFFILTANDVQNIPSALRDRLEIIEINSYTELEKIDIAKKYIIPDILKVYNTNKIRIADNVLLTIINCYTKESGVRELRRVIEKIYRYVIINNLKIKSISSEKIIEILGPYKYDLKSSRRNYIGSVNALGVTPFGGIIVSLEAILLSGNGNIHITGNVETSLKESAKIAFNYVLSKGKEYGIDMRKVNNHDFYINALNYSLKKDGTSGGVAITTSIISLLLGKIVDPFTCFTGEITLHGDVHKVGGIKEKIIGAYNNGFKTVFIPLENKNDLLNVPEEIKNNIEIITVSYYDEIFKFLFQKRK